MLSLDNKPLLIFESMTQASKESGATIGNISRCCSGKRKTSGGYQWELIQ